MRVPLFSKFLLWLLLNLALLAIVALVFLTVQFRFGLDVILSGPAGDRLQSISTLIASDLRESLRPEWNEILDRYAMAYDVQFSLRRGDGGYMAGSAAPLPELVRERFAGRPGLRGPGGVPLQSRRERPDSEVRGPRIGRPGRPAFFVRSVNPTTYWVGIPIAVRPEGERGPGMTVLLIQSPTLHAGGLFLDLRPIVFTAAVALGLSVVFWLPLVWGITRSITATTRTTEQIAEGQFNARVNTGARRDEIGQLAQSVNMLAQRLEGYVSGQKRFLGDIAHELCSPIARMQLALGIIEQRATSESHEHLKDLQEELEQMSKLVSELLAFSKASLGATAAQLQPVNLREAVNRAVAIENKSGATIAIELPDDLEVCADSGLLVRALSNLFRNAIRYAADAGPVRLSVERKNGEVFLYVRDHGPGVPEESLPKLFDPFFRVDTARTRETGGTGLGLTIVKTCIEACGGAVTCRNRKPTGFEMIVRLNAAT